MSRAVTEQIVTQNRRLVGFSVSKWLKFMEARSGQNHDNKIALQVSFNPTTVNIMDLLHIFVINKQYLFQRVIFSNMSYFCFNYTNTFFIHTMNYFSVVLRIIFLMCIENYFFIGPRIIFRGNANLFFGLQCFAGLAVRVFNFLSLGDHLYSNKHSAKVFYLESIWLCF